MCRCQDLLKQEEAICRLASIKTCQAMVRLCADQHAQQFGIIAQFFPSNDCKEIILQCPNCGERWSVKLKLDRRGKPTHFTVAAA